MNILLLIISWLLLFIADGQGVLTAFWFEALWWTLALITTIPITAGTMLVIGVVGALCTGGSLKDIVKIYLDRK